MRVKKDKLKRGQVASEYAALLAIVVAAVMAVSVFSQRAFKGKLFDAKNYMMEGARAALVKLNQEGQLAPGTVFYREYEPYYTDTESTLSQRATDTARIVDLGKSGQKVEYLDDQQTRVHSRSTQLPPGQGMANP